MTRFHGLDPDTRVRNPGFHRRRLPLSVRQLHGAGRASAWGNGCARLPYLPLFYSHFSPLVSLMAVSTMAPCFVPTVALGAASPLHLGRASACSAAATRSCLGTSRVAVSCRPTSAHVAAPQMMVAPTGQTPTPPAAAAGGDDAGEPDDGEVMLAPNLAIPAVLLTTAGLSATAGGGGGAVAAVPLGLLGAFLAFQTYYIRFVFTETELRVAKRSGGGWSTERGWAYSGWVNWELWWPSFPVLCYFREKDSYEGAGSPHFFPVIFNANQLLRALQTRTGITKDDYPTPPP